jgi:hypothetical protein
VQLGFGVNLTASGTTLTGYSAAVLMYAGVGADSMVHIYGLDLSNVAVVPTPQQISTLSVTDPTLICNYTQAQTDNSNPTTLFLVLEVAGSAGCGSSTAPDTFEVVRYTDAATAAPAIVNINTTNITPLYTAGVLSGIVVLDQSTSKLNFYSSTAFTAPSTLVTGALEANLMYDYADSSRSVAGTSYAFFDVTVGSTDYLYRVTAAGVATNLFTGAGSLNQDTVADNTNLYFLDFVSSSSTLTVYQEPLVGGAPMSLYVATLPGASATNLIGSNGSRLIFDQVVTGSSSALTSTLYSLPVGASSTAATTIGAPLSGGVVAFVAGSNPSDPATNKLFVNVNVNDNSTTPATVARSTLVYDFSGTLLQPQLANSVFQNGSSLFANGVVQFKGITDTSATYGGSSPYSVNVADLTSTVFKTSAGSPYVVPSLTSAYLVPLSTSVGEIGIFGASATSSGAAYDLSQFLVVPVTLANTNVHAL